MKIVFLQEYVRQNHVMERNGQATVQYKQSEGGKKLTALLKTIGLTARDYLVDYDYDLIPEPQKVDQRTGRVLKYKTPTLAMRKEPEQRLTKRLLETKPDIIVPMGEMGCKNFLGVTSITKSRGVPTKVTITDQETNESFETWVFPMFSMEYLTMNPNIENLVQADLVTLSKFLTQGEQAFEPKTVEYELVTDMERVREIFNDLYKNKPLTAWDLETNTLKPDRLGAKPLVLSMSWREAQGVTIPLEHHESPWTESELAETYTLLQRFLGDRRQPKVAHNGQYDVRFLMNTKNFQEFWDCRDTKIGYFLVITQESEDSKRLSDLAYEFTDMGGYDNPLEEYKEQYVKDYIEKECERIAQEKSVVKARIEKEYKVAMAQYKQTCAEYKELGKPTKGIPKPVKEKMPQFPTKSSIKPVNEIDGGDFNYDWIPLEIMHPYASGDTDCCLRIYNELVRRMQDLPKMYELWTNFYPNLTRALAHVESTGIAIDKEYAEVIEREYGKEEQRILAEIREFPAVQQLEGEHMALYQAGLAEWAKPPKERDIDIARLRDKYKISETENKVEFNPSSSVHKGKLLYKIMGLTLPYDKESIKDKPFDDGVPEHEITWADYRTNKHALEYLAEHHEEAKEIAGLLLDYSKVNTLKNNFAQKLPAMASNKDSRVHGSFNLTGTQCVAGDTLIVTDSGITPIESLSDLREPKQFAPLDIKVPTHTGSLEPANFFYSGFSNGLKLTLGDGTELTTTTEHPLMRNNYYTAESKRVSVKANYERYKEHINDNDWVPANQLQVGDWVQMAIGTEVYGNITELSYNHADYVKKITNRKEVALPTVLTPELAEWLGMYMADGHFSASNESCCIHLTNDDDSVRDRFKELSEKLFAVEAKHKYQKDRSPSIVIVSKMLGEWLSDLFHINVKSAEKNVPDLVLCSTKEVQQGFIRGLTLDSATEKKRYPSLVLSSVSKDMMRRVRVMLTNMGFLTRATIAKRYDDFRLAVHQIFITFNELDKFMTEIGLVEQCKYNRLLEKFEQYQSSKKSKFQGVMRCEDITLSKIVKIETVDNLEFFDLNVPSVHSFVGNGVINHNTSRLSSNNPNLKLGVAV